MLYCPKCQHTYETGSQRFCSNDGTRLLIASAGKSANQPGGVFSSLLGRKLPNIANSARDENLSPTPRYVPFEKPAIPDFLNSEIALDDDETPAKPVARMVKPNEIHSGTAEVGDRKANPTGRLALTWEQPKILFGQVVKGRYYVVDLLGQDEVSMSYLAEDKIIPDKKVFVRVFMDEDTNDTLANKIFAEERVSLSHINHPNIANVIDSGELQEGKPFIVSEYMDGKTVKDMLTQTGQFNALRTARIIRQASYALSEVHQNGILHRNLKPENIFLMISESGAEQVKLTNFGVLYDKINESNIVYKSPEQIEGKLSNFASDIYSLAVIAYQMLTNRVPFSAASGNALLRAQRDGLTLFPTNLRLDVPPLVDDILEKALSYNPSDRYSKARDFGDAFFNALTTASPWESAKTTEIEQTDEEEDEAFGLTPIVSPFETEETEAEFSEEEKELEREAEMEAAFMEDPDVESDEAESIQKPADGLPWEKRSPDPVAAPKPNWFLLSIFVAGLIVFLFVWYYFLSRPAEIVQVPVAGDQNVENTTNPDTNIIQGNPSPAVEIETPPLKRIVPQPPNTLYFENSKQNLSAEMAKNFLGFSIYYPKDWVKTSDENNFLDVGKNSPDGFALKKVIITRYPSKGTFNADRALFPALKEKSDGDLQKAPLTIYQVISAGETTIQNGRWKVYEVKFQGGLPGADGKELSLWGRRFWIPVQRPGMKNGFVITILATSLAQDVSSVDDIIANEELRQILETFEPATD
jgi:serine/threonine protein kinase